MTNTMVLMERYGITSELNSIYRYRNHNFNKLQDAINFAKVYHEQAEENFVLENEHPILLKRKKKPNGK